MEGVPVSEPREITWADRSDPHTISVAIPYAPSGVYFARLKDGAGRVGYAPFVMRPSKFGSVARVLVVEPTNTWQAYNFQDSDGNGWGDTWYAGPKAHPATLHVRLHRPFLHRGVPPHFRNYDLDFLHWLSEWNKKADYVADSDLVAFSGVQLRRTYDLIVFPGHEEYVTPHAYAIVRRFRNLGGHLIFLSANNFYWRVVRRGATLVRTVRWREIGHPEAALIGVEYRANNYHKPNRPYVLRRAPRWLFDGTGVGPGSRFGRFGIEIDSKAPSSPRGTLVLATIPHIFGRGYTADMTYYETRRGAKVFAFGAFSMGGVATQKPYSVMLVNLWKKMVP
jgi:N,N-dimethylformamidase beta subunit-like, C-terminal